MNVQYAVFIWVNRRDGGAYVRADRLEFGSYEAVVNHYGGGWPRNNKTSQFHKWTVKGRQFKIKHVW